ncbi:MAG TPA: SDR family oxidoreductase [Chthonomonadales bacterium]|nr:SDR family oxidoreductase [Chthonomonadales bacterium]
MAADLALVTGGLGFIGSHVVRALVAEGTRVRVLDNGSTGSMENLAGLCRSVEVIEGDVRNAIACGSACRGVHTVYHLAAYISVPGSIQDPVTADAVNIGGALNLLMAAHRAGARRLVFSSSAAVYGETDVVPAHENLSPAPLSPYGVEKVYGEMMCRVYDALHGLETVALRYFNVYGPRQDPRSEYAAVVPRFISMLLAGETPTIYGDGEQTRDFLFVEDVARANLLAAKAPEARGHTVNIGGGVRITVNALYGALRDAVGQGGAPIHGPERAGDIRHSGADIRRAQALLGFAPDVSLAEGLRRTVAFHQDQQAA